MPRDPWKTVRVIVEVPVQTARGRRFSEKDLSRIVGGAIGEMDALNEDAKHLSNDLKPVFGRVRVREFGRSMAAKKRIAK